MENRYKKNFGSFLYEDLQPIMLDKTIGIIGCGGNGGYIAEFLARFGVKKLILWDGDSFEESNLNRQFCSNEKILGENKAIYVAATCELINSDIEYISHECYLEDEPDDIMSCDLLVWAADGSHNVLLTRELVRCALEKGIPIVDQCISNRGGQISIITKEGLSIYDDNTKIWCRSQGEVNISQPAYLCAILAGMTTSHIIKYFAQEQNPVINQVINYDICMDQIHRIDYTYGQMY